MEEKKYSVDEILAEARQFAPSHSAEEISRKADEQAQQILNSLQQDKPKKSDDAAFEALLSEIKARAAGEKAPKPAVRAKTKQPHAEKKPEKEPRIAKVAPVVPPKGENDIVIAPAPSDVPQSKKAHRSLNEVMRDVMPDSDNKIDKALYDQKEESAGKRENKLTRTGVIRKADALIEETPPQPQPAPAVTSAPRMGDLQKKEKIVGDKEDIQTKAYNEYIRRKQKKKQDTGMIKTIDIKHAPIEKSSPSAAKSQAVEEKTKVHAFAVVDKQTQIEKTLVADRPNRVITNMNHTGNIEGQTRLEGFFDDSEFEKISEDELEEQLELNRRAKIDRFELEQEFKERNSDEPVAAVQSAIDETYAPEKETPVINDVIDYNSKSDQRAVYLELEALLNRFKLRTTITFIAELVVAVVGIFGSGILNDFGLGTGTERIYIIINTALLLVMMIVNGRAIFKGMKALILLKPSGDSVMALASIVTLAQCVLGLTLGASGAGVSHIYVGAMGFVFLLNCFGKRSMIRRTFKNFRFLIKSGEKFTATAITEPKEAKEFAKGTALEYIDIRYNAKTAFPTRFLGHSYADDPSDSIAKWAAFPAIGLSVVIGIITYFITKDSMAAVCALNAAMILGIPASSIMAFNKALENADTALLKERGTITGFAALKDVAGTSAIVLGAEEIFPENTCALKGMKLFKKMQMDEAILYAASVLEKTAHPFRNVFMESISEVKDHMPESFDTAYEAKLGLSTWIYDRKVLLGNKEMMGAHGIEIPATAKPEDYMTQNRRVMFLAIDGSVYAMFVLEYYSDPIIEYELQRLEASGIEILVKTEDSGIDQSLLCELFELEKDSVKILSMLAGNIYDEKQQQEIYNEAKVINRGDPVTFMRSITACSILNGQFGLLRLLQYACIILGVVIIAVLSFMGSISSIGPVHIVIYAAFWMIVTNLIPRIYKAVPKR
ncbi:MAG: hypothetical protein IJI67_00970 [Clostridia bacterium]|nr:hypothetical protein [Clostridia bacterium]